MPSSPADQRPAGAGSARRFGAFELDLRTGELRREGLPIKLQPQPFRVLAMLVDRAGDLVSRDELKRALWGEDTYVDFERGLNFCINQVRAALGDSAAAPEYIQTLPRRGYRFIAPVERDLGAEPQPAAGLAPEADLVRHSASSWRVMVPGVAFLAAITAGAVFLAGRSGGPVPAPGGGRTMIAVLPLEDLTGDPAPAWLADGLTDELIAQVGRVSPSRLGVIARTSAMTYRGSGKTVREIGRELRVSHVLEGSLRREGSRLRVTVRLVGTDDQAPIWSETYDRSLHGALTIQSEVAAQITRALALELLEAPWAAPGWTGTHRPEARDALLRGRHFLSRGSPRDIMTALTHLEDAIRQDPSFAAAHAAVAQGQHLAAMFGATPPADAYLRARVAAREALRLDPNLADSHTAAGLVALWADWNPPDAAAAFRRAVAINPSDAVAHHDLAWALVALQRFDEAAAHITRARDLDPMSPRASTDIGWLFLHIRQPTEALRACRQTLALNSASIEAQHCLERAHLQRGEFAEALAAARAAAARRGDATVAGGEAGTAEERLMHLWRSRLARLRAIAGSGMVSPYTLAMHHAVLGDADEAVAWLETARDRRAPALVLLPTDPVFESLRDHPRFRGLIASLHP